MAFVVTRGPGQYTTLEESHDVYYEANDPTDCSWQSRHEAE